MATKRFDSDHTIGIEMYHRILYQIINQHKKYVRNSDRLHNRRLLVFLMQLRLELGHTIRRAGDESVLNPQNSIGPPN